MIADLICLGVLCLFLAMDRVVVFYRVEPDSLWMYWGWIWAGYCALVFFLYAFWQLRSARGTVGRYFGLFGRTFLILCLAVAFGTWFDVCLEPRDRGEWPLAIWGLLVPGVPAAFIAFTVGFIWRGCVHVPSNQSLHLRTPKAFASVPTPKAAGGLARHGQSDRIGGPA